MCLQIKLWCVFIVSIIFTDDNFIVFHFVFCVQIWKCRSKIAWKSSKLWKWCWSITNIWEFIIRDVGYCNQLIPVWCRWLTYLPFTQDPRVRVPVPECIFCSSWKLYLSSPFYMPHLLRHFHTLQIGYDVIQLHCSAVME